ncbi:MAG TPA: hypothetical protein PLR22_10565 [Saprospiraceae bacterium]|nr:hypothetical protein [Saprospiraceae bacterium]
MKIFKSEFGELEKHRWMRVCTEHQTMPSKTPLAQGTKTCYLQLVFGAIPKW